MPSTVSAIFTAACPSASPYPSADSLTATSVRISQNLSGKHLACTLAVGRLGVLPGWSRTLSNQEHLIHDLQGVGYKMSSRTAITANVFQACISLTLHVENTRPDPKPFTCGLHACLASDGTVALQQGSSIEFGKDVCLRKQVFWHTVTHIKSHIQRRAVVK
jgi:hypothetical protein